VVTRLTQPKNHANCNKAYFYILYGCQNKNPYFSLTALVGLFLKGTQIFTAQCEMNV